MSSKHTQGQVCQSCIEKLETVHPYMRDWFIGRKSENLDLHLSWGYRGKEDQEDAFARGATKDHFPHSPHNRLNPETKSPESYAVDLFQLTPDGRAKYDQVLLAKIANECRARKDQVVWGGHFKSLGDACHFQYVPDSLG